MPLPPHLTIAAGLLAQARVTHKRLPSLPDEARPESIEEAYDCQGAVVEGLLRHYGGQVAGYKVACTNVIAQRQLGVDGPFTAGCRPHSCLRVRPGWIPASFSCA